MIGTDIVRRGIDVLVGGVALVVALPVIAVVAGLTRVTAGSPVIYRQRRIGRGGHPFALLKFRTMRDPRPGREAPEYDAERITRVGALLRSTSLDELPSLVNVVRGDIGLVGPRPLPVHYWPRFRREEYERFTVRPGLTGLAQITGRNQLGWDERLATDVQYVRTRTLRNDIGIIVRTVPAVLAQRGIAEDEAATMTELPADRP